MRQREQQWQKMLTEQREADKKLQEERDKQWMAQLNDLKDQVNPTLQVIVISVERVLESVWCDIQYLVS